MLCEKEKFIGHHIGRTEHAFRAFFTNELKTQNLSLEQGIILFIVSEMPNINTTDIAEILKKNKATISREIASLIAKKFISAKITKDDKRVKTFTITSSGKITLKLAEDKIQKMEKLLHTQISQQEIDVCLDVLSRMRNIITENMDINNT